MNTRLLGSAFWPTLILSALTAVLTWPGAYAQSSDFDTTIDHYNDKVTIDGAAKFTIEYHNWYKVLRNNVLGESYALVCCNQTLANNGTFKAVINTPVQYVAVDDALNVLPYLQLLERTNAVVSIDTYQDATSPCYDSVTNVSSWTAAFSFTNEAKANTQIQYVGFTPDGDDLTPLQKTSWLTYAAAFFDQETAAAKIFTAISEEYNCHKGNLAEIAKTTTIALTNYDAASSQWTLYSQAYQSTLISDAGGKLVTPPSGGIATLDDFQTAIESADYVIDLTALVTLGNAPYDQWLAFAGLGNNATYYNNIFLKNKNIYRLDGLVNENGHSDWPQRSSARPDLVLRDVIHMFEPTYERNYNWTWMRNFAKADLPRLVSTTNYPCGIPNFACQTNIFHGGDSVSDGSGDTSPSKSLSKGSVAGVVVGVVAFAGIAAVAGMFLYRRYRRAQPKRTFYRMNDIQ